MALTIGNHGTPGTATPSAAPQGGSQPAARVMAAVPEPALQQQPEPARTPQVQKAVAAVKQWVEAKAPNSLTFLIDDSTGRTIVRITDTETGEMIRQIPSEEILDIARSLDKMQGMLLQEQG